MKLIFEKSIPKHKGYSLPSLTDEENNVELNLPNHLLRKKAPNLPEISENEVVRHYIELSTLNYHIDKNMYPLGSCTMKYNPKANEAVANQDGFLELHPSQPESSVQGALELMYELSRSLAEISGLKAVTLQPLAGAHGELTGIFIIRKYHEIKNQSPRKTILTLDSSHGTNPASAMIGGYNVLTVKSNSNGLTDINDFYSKLNQDVAALMITNPNTVGLFETQIEEISHALKKNDSLLYMDGANMNALLCLVKPADMGVDILHFNLHKSFSTPHGGGGPGAGPVGVCQKLLPFLPKPVVEKKLVNNEPYFMLNWDKPLSIGRMSSYWGNFGVMVRAYAYILMHGQEGLRKNTEFSIINANYLFSLLKNFYVVPYKGPFMHEFCLSAIKQKKKGSRALDIAKRIIDYGFHAPTIYFPLIVNECLMIEPTETESKQTLEKFANALISIAKEIDNDIDLVLKAPHTTKTRRLSDAYAAKNINVKYPPNQT